MGSVVADEASTNRFAESAIRDLSAVHQLIVTSHPGAIDKENTNFAGWVEYGYLQAKKLSLLVSSRRDAQAVLGFYISGFKDGHVGIYHSEKGRSSWAGFILDKRGRTSLSVMLQRAGQPPCLQSVPASSHVTGKSSMKYWPMRYHPMSIADWI